MAKIMDCVFNDPEIAVQIKQTKEEGHKLILILLCKLFFMEEQEVLLCPSTN